MYAELLKLFWQLPDAQDHFQAANRLRMEIESSETFSKTSRLQAMSLWLVLIELKTKGNKDLDYLESSWSHIKTFKSSLSAVTVLPFAIFIVRYCNELLKKGEINNVIDILETYYPNQDTAIRWQDIFSLTNDPVPTEEGQEELQKVKLHILEKLAGIYYREEKWASFARSYHRWFKLVLENVTHCPIEKIVERLAGFSAWLTKFGWLVESQLHLTLAESIINIKYHNDEKLPQKSVHRVSLGWISLYRAHLERSTAKILAKAYNSLEIKEPWNWPESEFLEEMNFYPVELELQDLAIRNGEDAFRIFLLIIYYLLQLPLSRSEKASQLSIYLAFLAEHQPTIDLKYEVQKMRAYLLDFTIANSNNNNHPLPGEEIAMLLQDLAEVQLEMININLERIFDKLPNQGEHQRLLEKMEATAELHMRLQHLGKALGEAQDRDDPEFAKCFL